MSNKKERSKTQELWAASNQKHNLALNLCFMVCVDLVGPFTISTPSTTHSLIVLTMIDPATGCVEIVKATNKSTISIQNFL
jgi:hypothetical protein